MRRLGSVLPDSGPAPRSRPPSAAAALPVGQREKPTNPAEEEELPELPMLMGRVSLGLREPDPQAPKPRATDEDLSVYQQAALAERERKAAWKRWLQQGGGAKDFAKLADQLEPGWRISKPILCCTCRTWCACKEDSLDVRSSKSPFVLEVGSDAKPSERPA
ncbi:unnamed protein product [Effrenium voratum]|uniref:Uncharacterized protein n=1 Tax=Effrenium voratum TaxID=2562239 RepID=A0AA36IFE5_9DINO|nr:unnamed protein product [Effrenium voratum]|mmetsp:Transcript_20254/g.47983  ORF Transcript_20254/g.47983 Transcript_20254/m.47983 type:complete len:162 (-) Transcript_20254:269-754(-)